MSCFGVHVYTSLFCTQAAPHPDYVVVLSELFGGDTAQFGALDPPILGLFYKSLQS